jgi:hypothetical protein
VRRPIIYLVAVLLVIVAFAVSSPFFNQSSVTNVVVTLTAVLGALGIYAELRQEKLIRQAELLHDYNQDFLESAPLVDLEHRLERYAKTGERLVLSEEDRQIVVDYLVYLEALAALEDGGVLTLASMDNLFAYRFFLITNARVIQDLELATVEDSVFYLGIYRLYGKWRKFREGKQGAMRRVRPTGAPLYPIVLFPANQAGQQRMLTETSAYRTLMGEYSG